MEVAPHVGAWIEISRTKSDVMMWRSHPTWVRGLKYHPRAAQFVKAGSHPTWVRGLKLSSSLSAACCAAVAPHVGAWIEISARSGSPGYLPVAPHVGAWIEIPSCHVLTMVLGRTPRGCVD